MKQQVWYKKVLGIFHLSKQDVTDDQFEPLPLYLQLSWNHYLGFYKPIIKQFFYSYLPFPIYDNGFWFQLQGKQKQISQTQIINHIFTREFDNFQAPLQIICHFRSRKDKIQPDLQQYYKNNLKASTASRYSKKGAARLTLEMSINNFNNMYTNFLKNDLKQFKGDSNFQQDHLGYDFLIAEAEDIPVKILSQNFTIQRKFSKRSTMNQLINIFLTEQEKTEDNISNLKLKLSGIAISIRHLNATFGQLEKYCHPDGYLYFILIQAD